MLAVLKHQMMKLVSPHAHYCMQGCIECVSSAPDMMSSRATICSAQALWLCVQQ